MRAPGQEFADDLEPEALGRDDFAIVSIAISLKRIADTLTETDGDGYTPVRMLNSTIEDFRNALVSAIRKARA